MNLDRGAHNREQGVDRFAVHRCELDGRRQKAERHQRLQNAHHNRVAHVRNGDAVADAGGAQRFPRENDVQQQVAIQLLRQRHATNGGGQRGVLVPAGDAVVDAPRLHRGGKRRSRHARYVRRVEYLGRNSHALRDRPLQQFHAVKAILFVHAVCSQRALLDPTIDRLFGHFQQPCGVSDGKFHCSQILSKRFPACGIRTNCESYPSESRVASAFSAAATERVNGRA